MNTIGLLEMHGLGRDSGLLDSFLFATAPYPNARPLIAGDMVLSIKPESVSAPANEPSISQVALVNDHHQLDWMADYSWYGQQVTAKIAVGGVLQTLFVGQVNRVDFTTMGVTVVVSSESVAEGIVMKYSHGERIIWDPLPETVYFTNITPSNPDHGVLIKDGFSHKATFHYADGFHEPGFDPAWPVEYDGDAVYDGPVGSATPMTVDTIKGFISSGRTKNMLVDNQALYIT